MAQKSRCSPLQTPSPTVISSLPPIPPQHPEVYLDKTHNWLLEGVPYVDRVKYAEAQPEKPKRGFGTSDYSKRDEFSMDFRTEQMREALKSEARHQAIASEKAKAAMEKELAASGVALRVPRRTKIRPKDLIDEDQENRSSTTLCSTARTPTRRRCGTP